MSTHLRLEPHVETLNAVHLRHLLDAIDFILLEDASRDDDGGVLRDLIIRYRSVRI